MRMVSALNVTEALPLGIKLLMECGEEVSPRGMLTLEAPGPVVTVYQRPWQRVMLHSKRDANPFFHLFESLWILNGSKDVAWLSQFNSNIANYSDDGETFHAAYGHRLRYHFNVDQIKECIDLLKKEPDTRRAVLQIWSCNDDLNKDSKDLPCNDTVFLKIRNGKLNITVCCRSNDIIWGAYGANAVQFSMLQEYIAAMVGVEMGVYTQISDSYHAYVNNPQWEDLKNLPVMDLYDIWYDDSCLIPIVEYPSTWDAELDIFYHIAEPKEGAVKIPGSSIFRNKWFSKVAIPMFIAWRCHKDWKDGRTMASAIQAPDWRLACETWLEKREEK